MTEIEAMLHLQKIHPTAVIAGDTANKTIRVCTKTNYPDMITRNVVYLYKLEDGFLWFDGEDKKHEDHTH
jgi:hypothetical protein